MIAEIAHHSDMIWRKNGVLMDIESRTSTSRTESSMAGVCRLARAVPILIHWQRCYPNTNTVVTQSCKWRGESLAKKLGGISAIGTFYLIEALDDSAGKAFCRLVRFEGGKQGLVWRLSDSWATNH